jgi:hypothetical protein
MTDDSSESKSRKQLYLRMLIFALIGFVLFFCGAWLRLTQPGAFKYASNPYTGPPPLLTCLFCGGIGIIFGAVAGLFRNKR